MYVPCILTTSYCWSTSGASPSKPSPSLPSFSPRQTLPITSPVLTQPRGLPTPSTPHRALSLESSWSLDPGSWRWSFSRPTVANVSRSTN